MDSFARAFLEREIRIGKHRLAVREFLMLAILTFLAIGVRVSVRTFVSDDWTIYWSDWLARLEVQGFRALADDFYDYAPPVMYVLYLITLLPVNAMTAFKGLCCVMELVGAVLIGRIVFLSTGSRRKSFLSYGVFLLLPTVILNASVWAQCDIIYTLLILYCVYFLMKDRPWMAMWFYGAAFAVKLQTLFIFPFLILLWVGKKIEMKHFITIPVMYFVGVLPAWMAGRPFSELLGIYAFQGGKDRWSLSIKFPNIYQIIGNNFFLDEYVPAGIYLILGILMLVLFYMAYRRVRVTGEYMVLLVVFFGMLTTYFLPHMHERYLYLTDAFFLIYAMIRVSRFPWFVTESFLAVVGYGQYLTKNENPIHYGILAFVQLFLLIGIGLDLYRYLHAPENMAETQAEGKQDWLRGLLFRKFHFGSCSFDFLEGLLAVCITGVGILLRTPFETGLPHWPYLLCEFLLAAAGAVLVWRYTGSRMRCIGTYAILLILPTVIAEGTILRGDAVVGALLFICALLLLERESLWLFTLAAAAALFLSVNYAGILFACMVLWQRRRLKTEHLLVLGLAGAVRLAAAYRAWLTAGYTLVTFHWPNIYEIVGKAAVQGQLVDPVALVGLFLSFGLLIMTVWVFSQSKKDVCGTELFLFFGLVAGFFLPYMNQSCGYVWCVLSVVYAMLRPEGFLIPVLLQILTFAGYQECINGESMMPIAGFAVIQFLLIAYLGISLLWKTEALGEEFFVDFPGRLEWKRKE